ncbi:MAG: hypothetical protein HY905_09550 [Deltaproteobacteria bacterium]|nr:hypothetical protein [Deltaproteobacteria bacterium]
MGLRRASGSRAAAALLCGLAFGAAPSSARADVITCSLNAEAEGTDVRVELVMGRSASGYSGYCPADRVLGRTDDTGSRESLAGEWGSGCTLDRLAGEDCCGYYLDRCTPPGHLVYELTSTCGNPGPYGAPRTSVVNRGPDACPATDAGCGCAASGAPLGWLALWLVGSMLLLGSWALRRDRRAH